MNTAIYAVVATEHITDLHRAAEGWGAIPCQPKAGGAVELRLMHAGDVRAVRRLAVLDEALELEGDVLLALIDGKAVAGLSFCDRRVVANPFVATSEAVSLLRLRAEQLSGAEAPRRRLGRILRPAPRLVA